MTNLADDYFTFAALNTKLSDHYEIKFLNIPNLTASGVTYLEALYYSYRVLSTFLVPFQDNLEKILPYTFQTSALERISDHQFVTLNFAKRPFDPHQIQTRLLLPLFVPKNIASDIQRFNNLLYK